MCCVHKYRRTFLLRFAFGHASHQLFAELNEVAGNLWPKKKGLYEALR